MIKLMTRGTFSWPPTNSKLRICCPNNVGRKHQRNNRNFVKLTSKLNDFHNLIFLFAETRRDFCQTCFIFWVSLITLHIREIDILANWQKYSVVRCTWTQTNTNCPSNLLARQDKFLLSVSLYLLFSRFVYTHTKLTFGNIARLLKID